MHKVGVHWIDILQLVEHPVFVQEFATGGLVYGHTVEMVG